MSLKDPRPQRASILRNEDEKDRYWLGQILFLRRKIFGLCIYKEQVNRVSVLDAIDECLPEPILIAEKKRLSDIKHGGKVI